AYTLSADGTEPHCLEGSVLDWLSGSGVSWLQAGLLSDVERLRPEALLDTDFMAAGLAAGERTGANMAMEVLPGECERQARLLDSLVLARSARTSSSTAAAAPTSTSMPTIPTSPASSRAASAYSSSGGASSSEGGSSSSSRNSSHGGGAGSYAPPSA
ncbi:hypothetical protein Agub_g1607, partial [Astrephomene gubernaculifera]